MLQNPKEVLRTLWNTVLHGPDRLVQSHMFQQTSKFGEDKAHHLAPPVLVSGMNPPERAEVSGKITPYLHELINKKAEGFPLLGNQT